MKPGNRGIRGIRHPVVGGYVIGRRFGAGRGAPQYLSPYEVAQMVNRAGVIPNQPPSPPILIEASTTKADGAVSLLTGIPANVLNITLFPGIWDLSANVTFDPASSGITSFSHCVAALSMTSAVIPAPPHGGGYVELTGTLSTTKGVTLTTAVMRLTITDTGPVWLVAQATFS